VGKGREEGGRKKRSFNQLSFFLQSGDPPQPLAGPVPGFTTCPGSLLTPVPSFLACLRPWAALLVKFWDPRVVTIRLSFLFAVHCSVEMLFTYPTNHPTDRCSSVNFGVFTDGRTLHHGHV
jgi:hypothetical protein